MLPVLTDNTQDHIEKESTLRSLWLLPTSFRSHFWKLVRRVFHDDVDYLTTIFANHNC